MRDAGERVRRVRSERADEARRFPGRRRQDNPCGRALAARGRESPAYLLERCHALHACFGLEPGAETRGKRLRKRLEPLAEGEEATRDGAVSRRFLALGERPAQEAAVIAIPAGETRKGRRDRDRTGRAGEDAADERLDEPVGDFVPQAAGEKGMDALLRIRAPAREGLGQEAQLSSSRKKRRPRETSRRHGQRMELPLPLHVPGQTRVGEQGFFPKAEISDQGPQFGGRPNGVGTELQKEPVLALRVNGPARTGGGLQGQDFFSTPEVCPGSDQPRHPCADDDRAGRAHWLQNSFWERMMSSSARRNVGRLFNPGVLRKCEIPAFSAALPKS